MDIGAMVGAMESRPDKGRFDILVLWLALKNPQKNQAAVAILRHLGKPAVPLLIHEAIKPGKRAHHRIAILEVVRQIGGPVGLDEMLGLQSLLRHRNLGVRQKAERVIMSMSTGGVPSSPEGLATMRAFNPFLAVPSQRQSTGKMAGENVTKPPNHDKSG
jgi:hypothetical protein